MTTWYLIVFFTASISIVPLPTKQACDELARVTAQAYGKGSGFVGTSCTRIDGDGASGAIRGPK